MDYRPIVPLRPLRVEEIVTVHYYEYASGYYFEGERHDFWELLYVDKGTVEVQAGQRALTLSQGQIIFHQPGEFHALRCTGPRAPDLVVISFRCAGADMDFFRQRVMSLGDLGKDLLGRMVEEAGNAFAGPLDDPLSAGMERRDGALFGAEALLAGALEELLIRLIRRDGSGPEKRPGSVIRAYGREELLGRVTAFLSANLSRALTLEEVCRVCLVGRSRLQQIFQEETGGGVMEYFGKMKVKAAQQMIREGRHNFTEVAASLGYQSLHYFSRHFKKVSGMTPSEYAASVKLISQKTKIP